MTKFRGKKSLSPEVVDAFLTDHLPYEINMFRALLYKLRTTHGAVVDNALIEAVAIHARNLIEFFKNKDPCDFDPRRFTQGSYKPNGNFIRSTLEAKINQQVAHLTAERTSDNAEKFTASLKEIVDALEFEISRFESALSTEYRQKWKLVVPPLKAER